jgi:two-component system alkaline phosphatase synthesis response regulator PhoP
MEDKKKILIAEDDLETLALLKSTFESNNFEVNTATDGIQALKLSRIFLPDVFLLDIKMPNLEGTSVCEQLRTYEEFKTTPIVFLTSSNEEEVEINSFQIGADDFISKPVKAKALVIRINKLIELKKHLQNFEKKTTRVANIVINHENYTIQYKGTVIDLAKKEFQLVEILASQPGKVFTRKEIFDRIWNKPIDSSDRTLDVHIRKIRLKTNDHLITTVKGIGFKININA